MRKKIICRNLFWFSLWHMRWCHLFLPPIHFASFFFCLSPQKKYLEVGRASHFPQEGSFGRSVGGYFSKFLALPPSVNEEGAWEDYAQHLHPSLALHSKRNRNKHRLVKIDAKKDTSKVLFFKFFRGEGAKRHYSKLSFFLGMRYTAGKRFIWWKYTNFPGKQFWIS